MGDNSFSGLVMDVSLWRAVGCQSQGGHWLRDSQSLWAPITWVVLGFSHVIDITGKVLLSYREFKDRTGERRKEWGKDRKCEKRGYASLSTEVMLGSAVSYMAHSELFLVILGTLFKLCGPASRFHQIIKVSSTRHFLYSYSLTSIQSDVSFVWCSYL